MREVNEMKVSIKEFEDVIESAITNYYNQFSYYMLKECSPQYRGLSKENDELQDRFPLISDVIENRALMNDYYSKDELEALAKYYENKMQLEDMERMEIYKMGLRTGIKVFYPLIELTEGTKKHNE